MYRASTYLHDPSAKFWAVVFCLNLEDAKQERRIIWKAAEPDPSYGVRIEGNIHLLDALHTIGRLPPYARTEDFKPMDYTRYIKDLLPFCSDRLASYLIEMLVRISIYRRMSLNLSELERKTSESHPTD